MIWKILSKSDKSSEQYHLASLSCGPAVSRFSDLKMISECIWCYIVEEICCELEQCE